MKNKKIFGAIIFLFCLFFYFCNKKEILPEEFVKLYFEDFSHLINQYYSLSENHKSENISTEYFNIVNRFQDKSLFEKLYGIPPSESLSKIPVSQQFDVFLYPHIYNEIKFISMEKENERAKVYVKIISKHIFYENFLTGLPGQRSFQEDPKEIEKIYKKLCFQIQVEFDAGEISWNDFYEAYNILLTQDIEDIYFKGAVLLIETEEQHTFYLEKDRNTWLIQNIERKLIDYELDIN